MEIKREREKEASMVHVGRQAAEDKPGPV